MIVFAACTGAGSEEATQAQDQLSGETTVWAPTARPGTDTDTDTKAVELGVKLRSDVDGTVNAVRFYKGATNTGTHTAHLWSSTGALLASATFTGETASGWQTARFATPIAVRAGKTYVASYHTNVGHYAADDGFFASRGVDTAPLHALRDGVDGANGVYHYGATAFPTDSYRATNYWVDVAFARAGTAAADAGASDATTVDAAPKPDAGAITDAAPRADAASMDASPPATGWPGPSNTGVPAGTVLKPWDNHTIVAGETLDGWDIPDSVNLDVPNVTIKRCHVHGSTLDDNAFGIKNRSSGHLTVVDTEIDHFSFGIGFDNWTGLRLNIHDTGDDGMKIGDNVTIKDSWIHEGVVTPGAHQDCGQVQSGVVNVVIQHNHLEKCSNAALFICPDLGPSTNGPILIDGNLLSGGNYTLYVLDGNNGQYFVKNITVSNNRFVRGSAQYGPTDINVPVTLTNNVYDDNGQAIP